MLIARVDGQFQLQYVFLTNNEVNYADHIFNLSITIHFSGNALSSKHCGFVMHIWVSVKKAQPITDWVFGMTIFFEVVSPTYKTRSLSNSITALFCDVI